MFSKLWRNGEWKEAIGNAHTLRKPRNMPEEEQGRRERERENPDAKVVVEEEEQLGNSAVPNVLE